MRLADVRAIYSNWPYSEAALGKVLKLTLLS